MGMWPGAPPPAHAYMSYLGPYSPGTSQGDVAEAAVQSWPLDALHLG